MPGLPRAGRRNRARPRERVGRVRAAVVDVETVPPPRAGQQGGDVVLGLTAGPVGPGSVIVGHGHLNVDDNEGGVCGSLTVEFPGYAGR